MRCSKGPRWAGILIDSSCVTGPAGITRLPIPNPLLQRPLTFSLSGLYPSSNWEADRRSSDRRPELDMPAPNDDVMSATQVEVLSVRRLE